MGDARNFFDEIAATLFDLTSLSVSQGLEKMGAYFHPKNNRAVMHSDSVLFCFRRYEELRDFASVSLGLDVMIM